MRVVVCIPIFYLYIISTCLRFFKFDIFFCNKYIIVAKDNRFKVKKKKKIKNVYISATINYYIFILSRARLKIIIIMDVSQEHE